MSVPRKYGLLRAIATILKVLAVLALLLGLAGMILMLTGGNAGALGDTFRTLGVAWLSTAGAVVFPLIGLVWFVQLFAFGSILSLLVDIEENTRALALPPQ